MRGLPLLRLLFTMGAFIAMGWPVWRLTHPAPPAKAAAPVADVGVEAAVPLGVEVAFAGPPPSGFQLRELDHVVLEGSGATEKGQWAARLPKEGVDLTFEAHWPDAAAQVAVLVSFNYPNGQKIERSLWGRGAMREVITIPQLPGDAP